MRQKSGGFDLHYPFLYGLVVGTEAQSVFEFGAGFSTQTILKALEQTGGHLITCDRRPLAQTGNPSSLSEIYKNRFTYLEGNSHSQLKRLSHETFDCVLHDGSHNARVVFSDLRAIIPRMKKNGIILIHDTEHPALSPLFLLKLAVRLALLSRLCRYEILTLPYGYGLSVVKITSDLGNGRVAPRWQKQTKPKPSEKTEN